MRFQNVDPTKAESVYVTALGLYEKLVTDYPMNVDYRMGLARCLQNQAIVLAGAGKVEQAKDIYTKAMANLDSNERDAEGPDRLRLRASILNNLGQLGLPTAEDAYRRSIALCQSLMDRTTTPNSADRHVLAIAQGNLGELLIQQKRLVDAGKTLTQSVASFDRLVAESPRSTDIQSHFGTILALQAKWMDLSGDTEKAKTTLASAVEHQREAVRLSKNGSAYRELLGDHLLELAQLDLKLRDYEAAARIALDLPRTVPASNRAQACFDAAKMLARLVGQLGGDSKLTQADRDRLTRNYVGRTIVFLREAIDTNPKLTDQIKTDADIKILESRPEFQAIMNTLVNLGQ